MKTVRKRRKNSWIFTTCWSWVSQSENHFIYFMIMWHLSREKLTCQRPKPDKRGSKYVVGWIKNYHIRFLCWVVEFGNVDVQFLMILSDDWTVEQKIKGINWRLIQLWIQKHSQSLIQMWAWEKQANNKTWITVETVVICQFVQNSQQLDPIFSSKWCKSLLICEYLMLFFTFYCTNYLNN